jgi:hypothetical protein
MTRLLRNAWVAILGDSVARLFCAALLRVGGDPAEEQPVLDRHRSFEYALAAPNSRVNFVWAPYAENITGTLREWQGQGRTPDVLVLGASLWHMLHVHNVTHYGDTLVGLRAVVGEVTSVRRRRPASAFWMSTTALVTDSLRTQEKRERLTPDQVSAYNEAAHSAMITPGPCHLLDVHRVTEGACVGCTHCPFRVFCVARMHTCASLTCMSAHPRYPACGDTCSDDGMHFHNATYDVLVQQWAAALRFLQHASALHRDT